MKTLLIFTRHGVTHLIIVDGDKRHLNGCDLQDIGITGTATDRQIELMDLAFDKEGNIDYHGYIISALSPLTLDILIAHEVNYIVFVRG